MARNYLERLVVRRERTMVCEADHRLGRTVRTSADIATIAREIIGREVCEVFVLFSLTARHAVNGYHEVSRGTLSTCQVAAGDVARIALLSGAPRFIVSHNHPSGDTTPSSEDIHLTRKIIEAFNLLGLTLLDHVIVSHDRHSSLLDMGVIS